MGDGGVVEVFGDFYESAGGAVAEQLGDFKGIAADDLSEVGDGLVHFDEAVSVLLEGVLHELGVDEEVVGFDGAGHDEAVAVVDIAATCGEGHDEMLLAIGAGDGGFAAVGLEIGDSADHGGEEGDDQDDRGLGEEWGEVGHMGWSDNSHRMNEGWFSRKGVWERWEQEIAKLPTLSRKFSFLKGGVGGGCPKMSGNA